MLKIDYIVFICFLIILETSKPENSSLFSFLKKKHKKTNYVWPPYSSKVNTYIKNLLKAYQLIDFPKCVVFLFSVFFKKNGDF